MYPKGGECDVGGKDEELTIDKGLDFSIVVEDVVEVVHLDGGFKGYELGVLRSSVQELQLCGGPEGSVHESVLQQVA